MGRLRAGLAVTLVAASVGVGAAACSSTSDDKSGATTNLDKLGPEVSKLRLEVEQLRKEVDALRQELQASSGTDTTDGSGSTTPDTTIETIPIG